MTQTVTNRQERLIQNIYNTMHCWVIVIAKTSICKIKNQPKLKSLSKVYLSFQLVYSPEVGMELPLVG